MVGATAGGTLTSAGPEQSLCHSGPPAAVSQSGFPRPEPEPQRPLAGLASALSSPHCPGRELCGSAVFPGHRVQGLGLAVFGLQFWLQTRGSGFLPAAWPTQGTLGQRTRSPRLALAAGQAIAPPLGTA